jgi:hypothetical protein
MRRIVAILLTAGAGLTQQVAARPPQSDAQSTAQAASANQNSTITVPAGTKVALSLTSPIWSRTAKVGDSVYSATSFPVAVGNGMAIPPGTFVEGKIDALTRPGRLSAHAEFQLHFTKIVFANGYTVELSDALENASRAPSQSLPGKATAFQPAASSAAPSNATVDVQPAIAIVYVEVTSRNDILLDNGAPIEMLLQSPLVFDADLVAEAVRVSKPLQIGPGNSSTRCVPTPGTSGTPDTVIPGTPGTPPTVIPGGPGMPDTVIPGSSGTPPTVIPGTPGFAGTVCPGPPIVTSQPTGKDAHTKTITLASPMQLGGAQLSAGRIQIRWTGLGPTAEVQIEQNKKQVAKLPARVVILATKSLADEAAPRTNADGSISLGSLQFAGETFALFFD